MKVRQSKKNSHFIQIAGEAVMPGEQKVISLDVARLYDFTEMVIPIEVISGSEPGPRLFISAAIHGDEINGVEIIRRLLKKIKPNKIKGTLVAVPVVNVFGFNNRSRYLPDRRDLNRCFPGSMRGSLASSVAYLFMKEIVSKCTHGIDLHTAPIHRVNLPQVRACLDDPETRKIAEVFGAGVLLNSKTRDGSLREAARKRNIPILLFEGGEALRFDEAVINTGVRGCLAVMKHIGMLSSGLKKMPAPPFFVARDSFWVRAPHSGSLRMYKDLGNEVAKGDVLAIVQDLFGKSRIEVLAPEDGIVIGKTQFPLVNKGDAVFHIATFKNLGKVSGHMKRYEVDSL